MPNSFYNTSFDVSPGTSVGSQRIEDQYKLVEQGFDGVSTALAAKANIASPAFTGNPTAPTPSTSDNSTSLATTAFVTSKIGSSLTGYASTIREQQTATASQTVFNLSNTYSINTNSINIFINGVRQFPGTYTETNSTRVTFSDPLRAGDVVLFEIGVITSGTNTAASAVSFNPASGITGPTVQDAIVQVKNSVAGSGGTTLTGNVTLTSASPAAMSVTPANPGLYVTLPDATTVSRSTAPFSVYNNGDFDYGVRDSAGTQLGWIRARTGAVIGLADNSTAAGVWAYYGLEKTGITASYVNSTLANMASAIRRIALDANRTCFLFGGTDCYAIVYDASTQVWGGATLVLGGGAVTSGLFLGVLSATNQVLVTILDTSNRLLAQTLTISGTSVTVNASVNVTNAGVAAAIGQLIAVGSSFVVSYARATTTSAIRAITVSGTVPTIGAESALTTANAGDTAIAMFASGSIVRCVHTQSSALRVSPYTVSGSTLSVGTLASVTTTAAPFRAFLNGNGRIVCHYINTTHFATIFSLSGTTETASSVSLGTNLGGGNIVSNTEYAAITVSKTVFYNSGNGTKYANILTDTAGTASAGTELNMGLLASGSSLPALVGVSGGVATFIDGYINNASNNAYLLISLNCSGASPSVSQVVSYAVNNTTTSVVMMPTVTSSDIYGVRNVTSLNVGNSLIVLGSTYAVNDLRVTSLVIKPERSLAIPNGPISGLITGIAGGASNESFVASPMRNLGYMIQRVEAAA